MFRSVRLSPNRRICHRIRLFIFIHFATPAIDAISPTNSKRFFCGNVKAGDHYQVTANAASDTKQLMHLWHSAGDFANTDYAATWIAIAHGVSASMKINVISADNFDQ
ncbi:hypothetical protein [Vibrio spartinae]|uniref:hypothetical protein n=1 Tax=Vibrio spartinae TaxID=1918945 RepID=UPI0015F85674|nr:hypothetical protein [Vibrio spartinae]